jgi:hypothetical protein
VSVRLTQPESSRAPHAAASTRHRSHRSSFAHPMEGERAAAREAMTAKSPTSATESCEPLMSPVVTETMIAGPVMRERLTAKSVSARSMSPKAMTREGPTSETVMAAPRMTCESLAASPAAPAVMSLSGMASMAGPAASCPAVSSLPACRPTVGVAATGPTGAMTAAMLLVSSKLEVAPAREVLSAGPVTVRSSTFAKSRLTEPPAAFPAPCEPRSLGRSAVSFGHPGATVKTSARSSSAFMIAGTAARPASFRTSRSGTRLPGDFPIGAATETRIVAHFAIVAHVAIFTAIAPVATASETLVGRVPTVGLLALVALARATADEPLIGPPVVSSLFAWGHAAVVSALVVAVFVVALAVTLARFASVTAAQLVRRPARTMATACGSAIVGTGARVVGLVIGIAPDVLVHFSRLDRIHSRVARSCEMQRSRCRNSSQKHQHAVTHRTVPRHLECRPILRIDAVTDSPKSVPHPRPMDVFRPRLTVTITGQP